MATFLIGNVRLYGEYGSWVFEYGDVDVGNFEQKKFLKSDYGGSSAKAKAAALKYWKDPARQKRWKESSAIGKLAKSHGYTYDEYQALSKDIKTRLTWQKSAVKSRAALIAGGEYETTFTVGGKKYTLPTYGFPKKRIPVLKSFLRSFNEWRNKGGNIEAYINLKGRGPDFDRNQGHVWRLLIRYARGLAPTRPGGSGSGEPYKAIFDKLKIPKKELDTLKNFTQETVDAAKIFKASAASAAAKGGNPLVAPIVNFVNKNPNATEEELFSAIRRTEGQNLTNSEIVRGTIRGHAQGTVRLLREGRGEIIGKSQLKSIKDFTSNQLRKALIVFYNLFPNQIFREFSGTVEEFYKNNPTLQKRALRKLKDYNSIRAKVIKNLELGEGRGRGGAAFQFDHPISFEVLKRGGNLEGAIRTNPIAGDVNQFKTALDRKLSEFQRNIISGTNVETNLSKIDSLKNINKTLFGKLAGDFTIDAKGKIKVMDYGAKTVLDPTYDIAKSLEANLPLGKHIKETVAAGRLAPQLKEVLGETGFKTFTAKANQLKTVFNAETAEIQRQIANALDCGRAEGGRIGYALGTPTINCVNTKLTNEPVQSSMRLRAAEGVGKIRTAARGFLGALGKWGPKVGKFGALAAVGAVAQPLVKQFMNDDPSTYLTDPDQQAGMLDALLEGKREKPRSEILDWSLGGAELGATASAVPGSGALYKYRRGLLEAKIPKAGPISKEGLTAGDYISRHTQKLLGGEGRGVAPQYGKIRAGAGVGMKLLSGMFTPAGLLATEPLRIAQKRREGESWGDIATSPETWMGPAFAPGMTRMATRGMNPASLLPKLLRLGMSRAALAAIGPVGWVGLAASLGWEGRKQYQDYKRGRGFFARDED